MAEQEPRIQEGGEARGVDIDAVSEVVDAAVRVHLAPTRVEVVPAEGDGYDVTWWVVDE